jgi:hypothetical protein
VGEIADPRIQTDDHGSEQPSNLTSHHRDDQATEDHHRGPTASGPAGYQRGMPARIGLRPAGRSLG